MAILPDITELETTFATKGSVVSIPVNPPTATWLIDFDSQERSVQYTTSGLAALKQAILLRLNVQRGRWLIYSSDYGQEFKDYLSKQDNDFVVAMLPTLISNTLMVDDRITKCEVYDIERQFGMVTCKIQLDTIFGEVAIEGYEVGL